MIHVSQLRKWGTLLAVISKWYSDIHCNQVHIMLPCLPRVQELNKTSCVSVCYLISCPGHWADFYYFGCCGFVLKVFTWKCFGSSWSTTLLTLPEAEIKLLSFCKNGLSYKKILNGVMKCRFDQVLQLAFQTFFWSSEYLMKQEGR